MNARRLIIAYLFVLLAGLIAATQWVAYRLDYHPDLGGLRVGPHVVYPPWAIFTRARDFSDNIPRALNEGYAFIGGAFILATLMLRNYLKTPIDGGDDTTTIRRRVE